MKYDVFNRRINNYKDLWTNINSTHTFNLPIYTKMQKKIMEKDIIKTKNKCLELLRKFPSDEESQNKWIIDFKYIITDFLTNLIIDKNHVIKYFMDKGIINSTSKFIELSKKENINLSQLGQALRNSWIMNILQLMFNKKIECSKSVFAYSMLYPYTDNYIDDQNICFNNKLIYSNNLAKKIKGHSISPQNSYEDNIFRMIDTINQQYNIKKYPNISESLLLIHLCQTHSINQNIAHNQSYNNIIDITFKKGASSVYVDGVLLDGNLTTKEEDFTLLYGIILQLCDDLIDIKEDRNNDSVTIFTYKETSKLLDNKVYKLFNMIEYLFVDKCKFVKFHNKENVMEFIYQCLYLLVIYGIVLNKKCFSKTLLKELEKYFPIRFKFLIKNTKDIKNEITKTFNKLDSITKSKITEVIK